MYCGTAHPCYDDHLYQVQQYNGAERKEGVCLRGGLSYVTIIYRDFVAAQCISSEPVPSFLGDERFVSPYRTAVSLWGQTSQFSSSLSPKRDCSPKRVNSTIYIVIVSEPDTSLSAKRVGGFDRTVLRGTIVNRTEY